MGKKKGKKQSKQSTSSTTVGSSTQQSQQERQLPQQSSSRSVRERDPELSQSQQSSSQHGSIEGNQNVSKKDTSKKSQKSKSQYTIPSLSFQPPLPPPSSSSSQPPLPPLPPSPSPSQSLPPLPPLPSSSSSSPSFPSLPKSSLSSQPPQPQKPVSFASLLKSKPSSSQSQPPQQWQQPSQQLQQSPQQWQQPSSSSQEPQQIWPQQSQEQSQVWPYPSQEQPQVWPYPSQEQPQVWPYPSQEQPQVWPYPSQEPMQVWPQQSQEPPQVWPQQSQESQQMWPLPSQQLQPPPQQWQQPSQQWPQPSQQSQLTQVWPQPSQKSHQSSQKWRQPSKSSQEAQQKSAKRLPPSQLSPQRAEPLPKKSLSPSQKSELPSPRSLSPSKKSESSSSSSYTEKEKLTKSVAGQLALSIPTRKNPNVCGTLGRPITVEINAMALEFQNLVTNISQYDVAISPDKPKCLMRSIFEEFRKKNFPTRYPAYDGNKIAYSANDLPFYTHIEDDVTIFENDHEKIFHIEMKKAAAIDLSFLKNVKPGFNETLGTQSGIQALDVILRHGPLSYCFPVGRSIFWQPMGRADSLSNGMELWIGSFQSAILGWKPLLNVDVAHKGFPKAQNVIDLMKELCLRGENRDITLEDVNQGKQKIIKFLVGLKVHYVIPNIPSSKRTQLVRGFVECPRINVFARSDGTSSTIEDYFRNEKNYIIRYPTLPCLWIGPETKKIYVPPELCTIAPGQTVRRKMDEMQTSKMIRFAATSSDRRKEKILEGFRALKINDHPTMRNEFNLSVKSEFERVPARVLNAPKLNYNNNDIVSVMKGVWRAKKFLNPSTLLDKQWTIINLVSGRIKDRDMYRLCDMLREGARAVGMFMGDALKPFQSCNNQLISLSHCFDKLKQNGIKLVIVIISDFNDSYSNVKQVSELRLGMLTQCIKSITVERKLNAATIGNILLKINSKLNGVNHEICGQVRPAILSPDCILIGADVTHPSPDAKNIPSIAAVAASCDRTAFRYKIEIRLQQPRQEIISDFAEIVKTLLRYYYRCTGIQPRKIIIYRDGVSEGQLTQVLHYELTALQNAFRSLSKDHSYHPSVTFLVVQKRHHIRFFPTDRRNSDDRNFNVQAGTIVDTHITHPSHIDFYLVSHASIQGTARPTKYKCVFNQLDMTEDQIEELTYYLCHMFARCTRSISYPAPTYYAHLAAFRARAFIQNVPIQLNKLQDEQVKVRVVLNEDVPMFYV
ncbi:protein argonaute-2-like [Vespula squamosa]|uniref:Protein argonaute-2-like n=1 Tax=Vespula squamosa TaxID=30214 RepID=A0ABD2B1K7_VESSQ